MITQKQIQQIKEIIRTKLNDLLFLHTLEVFKYAKFLAKKENANQEICEVAALLHDCAKSYSSELNHAEMGAEASQFIMTKAGIIDSQFVNQVYYCVLTHSSPYLVKPPHNLKRLMPQTIEAKVVFDADMLANMTQLGIIKNIFDYKNEELITCINYAFNDIKTYAFENLLTASGKEEGARKFKQVKKTLIEIIGQNLRGV